MSGQGLKVCGHLQGTWGRGSGIKILYNIARLARYSPP